jgi:glucosyl-3-phosphoglycerate synthase
MTSGGRTMGWMPRTLRTHDADDYGVDALAAAKGRTTVSVCLPARNEDRTIGHIVRAIRKDLVDRLGLVDEIVVVDDHSTDRTGTRAAAAGARVVAAADVLPEHGRGNGKGQALWKSLHASEGDLVVWCDADLHDFDLRFITGLLGPLLVDPQVAFVKGFYERPIDGRARGGGRVTELVARPLLTLLFPELAGVVQPLSGEYAGRREVLEQVPFVEDYGVDIALLVDISRLVGVDRIAQVDLGRRVHRNRPLEELGPMAAQVLQAALRRAAPGLVPDHAVLSAPGSEPVEISYRERPPLATLRRTELPG